MSNYSQNENLQNKNSHSDTESDPTGCDKTVAFLAALQETQNVLNILLHAVLYRDNTDLYEQNISHIKATLESENESKHSVMNLNIVREDDNVNNYNGKLLLPTSTISQETIHIESSKIQDIHVIPLPWIDQCLLENNKRDQQNTLNKSNIITSLNKKHSRLSHDHINPEKSSAAYKKEHETFPSKKMPKYDTEKKKLYTINNRNLTRPSPLLTRHPLEPPGSTNEQKMVHTLKTLKNEKEKNLPMPAEVSKIENCSNANPNILNKQGLQLPTYNDENDSEATGIPITEKELSEVEEIRKLLQLSLNSYISCENKVNSILNQIENHSDSMCDIIPYDQQCYDSTCNNSENLLETKTSSIQKGIGQKEETVENNKVKVLHLPPQSIPNSPSSGENEIIGDDSAKTNTHILCECDQPGVAGGAVPIVTSFVISVANSQQDNKNSPKNKTQEIITSYKLDRLEDENRPQKKPSLIPKLTNCFKNSDRLNLLSRTEKQRCLLPSDHNQNEEKKPHVTINITSKILSLQEQLKASTSLIREKISNSQDKPDDEKNNTDHNEKHHLRFDDESFNRQKRQKELRSEFSKNITKVAKDATNLRELSDLRAQTTIIENMYKYITELKRLSNQLNDMQEKECEKSCITDRPQDIDDNGTPSFEPGYKTKAKDNKIYIKFLSTKLGIKKKMFGNSEVQTDLTKEFVFNDICVDPKTEKQSTMENSVINVDSMDGMFIPSSEEPPKVEEDEDEDGLDITITFPEFQQHVMHQASSHLSVSFSDISAEALGRLKRCPKEFTLRMDFVHGKMFFQSGKLPANNFSIGPDYKITECVIDEKMSDIISIKPSTECMYNSQIIPVEGTKQKSSTRTLKSTDSELFNVVSLPTINRKASGKTKSCITFKNERYVSAGRILTERRSYKSMPQIPSLTKILEEPAMESAITNRSAMMSSDKKPRNRILQKKRTNTSLEKLSEA